MSCPVLINGKWRQAESSSTFQACDPATRKWLPDEYPVSSWQDCDEALAAASAASVAMREMSGEQLAAFLDAFAGEIEASKGALVAMAHAETGLPTSPRLADVELPRTTGQLRAAASAARVGSWSMATIDSANNIRSHYAPIGPVCVFGPNNFPFAFNSVAGGDFAAAIAAGNPVIGKANSSHPGTTRLFAEAALRAIEKTEMPPATVQLLYRTSHSDGEQLVSDQRVGAIGYTGSRIAGLKLKAAADSAGKPIYLELSSVNPVLVLPGALAERQGEIVDEVVTSALMGTGQFCTNLGIIMVVDDENSRKFVDELASRYQAAPVGILLSGGVQAGLEESIQVLEHAGAECLAGGACDEPQESFCCRNTLLKVAAATFLEHPNVLQTEAFGNCTLIVVADSVAQLAQTLPHLEGNLTGCIYSDRNGADDEAYRQLSPELRARVGRLLNDKMPTGVAVSAAMNHGGPFPATAHPGFTAVGVPASLLRFAALQCYDNVRQHRLPTGLRDANPNGEMWRMIDGQWSQADVG